MLVSKTWLNEFVTLPKGVSDEKLASRLTLSTVEVERVIDQAASLKGIVVGRVLSAIKHPNADRLNVCQVDVGGKQVQIVCGGTNVRAEMLVAVALPGSWVRWHGEGEPVELAETKIRGEASFGMICASVELGLDGSNEGEHEILDLTATKAKPGTPLARVLGRDEVLFDIEHKSLTNRPDLMGHYGMARELSALYDVKLAAFQPPAIRGGKGSTLSITVDDAALCPRYMALAIDGVIVGPSPDWMQRRLVACGVRSINNIVDVTNYVMLELGQPMHAFDAAALRAKGEIRVRKAKAGEKIVCLDDETYTLTPEMLVIANAEEPMAIAGVMGGKASAISPSTTSIVFESANFAPSSVRKTSQRLALRSESSARFEKSLDPMLCDLALRRAVELLQEICPSARVRSAVIDKKGRLPKPLVITLALDAPERLLGVKISSADVTGSLKRLGFSLRKSGKGFAVTVPTWRATKDVGLAADVIEEVARIYGYDRIPPTLPSFTIAPPPTDPMRQMTRTARRVLAGRFACTETYNYAFVSGETLIALHFPVDQHLSLANPLSDERPYLVRSLVPGVLEHLKKNQRLQESVRLFETARVFLGDQKGEEMGEGTSKLPAQPHLVTVGYGEKGNAEPFWEMKKIAAGLLDELGYAFELRTPSMRVTWMHPTRLAEVVVAGTVVGVIAEVAPGVQQAFGLDHRVAVLEVNLDALLKAQQVAAAYQPISTYPSVKRDVAFVIDDRIGYAKIEQTIRSASPLLTGVELFDLYRGKGVPEGKKSIAVHLELSAADRTLSSDEADVALKKVTEMLQKSFGATMR